MYDRLMYFLENHEILFNKQFGFRSQHNLTMLYYLYWIKSKNYSIEGREYSCGVFLDFGKAFDTVNHKILFNNETRTLWYRWN